MIEKLRQAIASRESLIEDTLKRKLKKALFLRHTDYAEKLRTEIELEETLLQNDLERLRNFEPVDQRVREQMSSFLPSVTDP